MIKKYETVAAFSGGANRGAELLGYMLNMKFKYDAIVTNSVTSLMAVHLKLGKLDELKRILSSVDHKNVFTRSPFNKDGSLNLWTLGKVLLQYKLSNFIPGVKAPKTIGDSRALRQFLDNKLAPTDFELAKLDGDLVITTYNQTNHRKEYHSIHGVDFEEFKDLMWLSANAPIVMSSGEFRKVKQYTDGGVAEVVPVQKAVEMATKRVEVYVCRSYDEVWGPRTESFNDLLGNMTNVLEGMQLETIRQDLIKGRDDANKKGIQLCEYYLCDSESEPVYLFHTPVMNRLLQKAGHRKLKTFRVN